MCVTQWRFGSSGLPSLKYLSGGTENGSCTGLSTTRRDAVEASSNGDVGHSVTTCRGSPTVLARGNVSGTEVSSTPLNVHRSLGRGVEASTRIPVFELVQQPFDRCIFIHTID